MENTGLDQNARIARLLPMSKQVYVRLGNGP